MDKTLAKLRQKQPITVVVVGDSNTIISMNTQGRMNWVGYLTEALWETYGDGLVTMINVSECGHTFLRLPDQLDRTILRWKPDLVIFQLWLGREHDGREGHDRGVVAFRECVKRIRDARPGETDILVCTPNPRVLCHGHPMPEGAEPGKVYDCAEWNATLHAELVALARESGCAVVDHYAAWAAKRYKFAHPGADPRGLWQRMIDNIHPNAVGHLAMFREMAPVFKVSPHFLWEEI